MHLLSANSAQRALAAGRIAISAGAFLAPGLLARTLGVDPDPGQNQAGPYLSRLFAARDAYLAVEVLTAPTAEARTAVIRRHIWLDASDAVAAGIAFARGQLRARGAVLGVGGACIAVGLGLRAASA